MIHPNDQRSAYLKKLFSFFILLWGYIMTRERLIIIFYLSSHNKDWDFLEVSGTRTTCFKSKTLNDNSETFESSWLIKTHKARLNLTITGQHFNKCNFKARNWMWLTVEDWWNLKWGNKIAIDWQFQTNEVLKSLSTTASHLLCVCRMRIEDEYTDKYYFNWIALLLC